MFKKGKLNTFPDKLAFIIIMNLCRVVHQLQAKLQYKWMQNATRDHFLVGWGVVFGLTKPIIVHCSVHVLGPITNVFNVSASNQAIFPHSTQLGMEAGNPGLNIILAFLT